MTRHVLVWFCLALAGLTLTAGCNKKATPPPMPQIANPEPGPGSSPEEVERYRLEEEKRGLMEQYGDNLARIQQINARLIELNIAISRQRHP
jgi:hypothetical protein